MASSDVQRTSMGFYSDNIAGRSASADANTGNVDDVIGSDDCHDDEVINDDVRSCRSLSNEAYCLSEEQQPDESDYIDIDDNCDERSSVSGLITSLPETATSSELSPVDLSTSTSVKRMSTCAIQKQIQSSEIQNSGDRRSLYHSIQQLSLPSSKSRDRRGDVSIDETATLNSNNFDQQSCDSVDSNYLATSKAAYFAKSSAVDYNSHYYSKHPHHMRSALDNIDVTSALKHVLNDGGTHASFTDWLRSGRRDDRYIRQQLPTDEDDIAFSRAEESQSDCTEACPSVENSGAVHAKRVRMETIIKSLRSSSPPLQPTASADRRSTSIDRNGCRSTTSTSSSPAQTVGICQQGIVGQVRSKRKRYIPQQHEATGNASNRASPTGCDVNDRKTGNGSSSLQEQLRSVEHQLRAMQAKCLMTMQSGLLDNWTSRSASTFGEKAEVATFNDQRFIELLKAEIDRSVGTLVESVVQSFVDKYISAISDASNADVGDNGREVTVDRVSTTASLNCKEMHENSTARWKPSSRMLPSEPATTLAAEYTSSPLHASMEHGRHALRGSQSVIEHVEMDNVIRSNILGSNSVNERSGRQLNFDLHQMRSRWDHQQNLPSPLSIETSKPETLQHLSQDDYKTRESNSRHPVSSNCTAMSSPRTRSQVQSAAEELPGSVNGSCTQPEVAMMTSMGHVATKKRRTKVTDTRLSPRAARAILNSSRGHIHKFAPYRLNRQLYRQNETSAETANHTEERKQQSGLSESSTRHRIDGPSFDDRFRFRENYSDHNVYRHLMSSHSEHKFPTLHYHRTMTEHPLLCRPISPSSHHVGRGSLNPIHSMLPAHPLDSTFLSARISTVGQSLADAQRCSSDPENLDVNTTNDAFPARNRSMFRSSSPGTSFRTLASSPEMHDGYECETNGYNTTYSNFNGVAKTSTLTPMHLRKAKLMFFYVRYPSSAILKVYFPDVQFNKNNTAQLVKWFSNFREFFYIQMEKYARQALADGVKKVSDLVVSRDDELFRILVLHYNRNNQLEVPESFRYVVEAALREFFMSIGAEKDLEQSWKKAIYKVIARLDDVIPEYFKSDNWLHQVASIGDQ